MITTVPPLARTDLGVGDPALLHLPGWCGGREVFDPLLEHAARHHRSISVDLPGHGDSPRPATDFGAAQVADAAVALIAAEQLTRVVPVALSHAGWTALEVLRRLGPDRVPAVVLLDWMPLGAPPQFGDALAALQDPQAWLAARAGLFTMWGEGVDHPAVLSYIASMGGYGFEAWSRAGREIARAFAAEPVPLAAFGRLPRPVPVLHVYAQPRDDAFLTAQRAYAVEHPWFSAARLEASSHFPSLEVPEQVMGAIGDFLSGLQ
jgi:pimeloyl-ACP methyl ester carboxylesterase